MDLQAAESDLIKTPKLRWLAREKESGRIYDWAAVGSALLLVGTLFLSYWMLSREAAPGSILSPPQIALLLIVNLVPSIALMVLLSRRIAMARAAARAIAGQQDIAEHQHAGEYDRGRDGRPIVNPAAFLLAG